MRDRPERERKEAQVVVLEQMFGGQTLGELDDESDAEGEGGDEVGALLVVFRFV